MKINNVIISIIISISCLYGNTPSISIESKYGEGKEFNSETNGFIGDYYYNESIMDINFNFDFGIYLYTQLEYSMPPLKGFDFVGINNYHLEYTSDKYKIKIGDIYTLYGRGLAINMFQDHQIDYDNSIKGIETNYYINDYLTLFLLAGKKDFLFRSNPVLDFPDLGVENYVYMFGFEKNTDNWGSFHYLFLNEETIANHDEYTLGSIKRFVFPTAVGLDEMVGSDTLCTSEHNFSWDVSFFNTDIYIEKSHIDYSTFDFTPGSFKNHKGSKLYFSLYKDVFDFGITYEYKNYWMPYYLKTLSNPPIVYRESVSSLASRNSHTMDWNDEVGHQLNIDRYINEMFSLEFNLSIAGKHKTYSDNSTFSDLLSISEVSFIRNPFRQFYIGFSGWFFNNKLYYKIGFDDFIQVKTIGNSSEHIAAHTIPSLFTLTLGDNSITAYLERQKKTETKFNEFTPVEEADYTNRYFSLTANYKGKISLSFFHEDEWAPLYSNWTGYDLTTNINPTTQLSLFFGDQKGGLVCANGVCAVQPDLNDGFKLTFRTLF